MEVLLCTWTQHCSLLIGSEGEGEDLVHFHDHSDFGGNCGWRQQLGSVHFLAEDDLSQVALVVLFGPAPAASLLEKKAATCRTLFLSVAAN